jgi:hypothetical protein
MATIATGSKHLSISFVVARNGQPSRVQSECHCTFGENHYADPADPRPVNDVEISSVTLRAVAA